MTAIKELTMNIQSHRFGRAAVILAAGAFLAACSSKPRERSAEGNDSPDYYGASGTGTDSIYP
jgi:hypothetical protein